MQPWFVMERVVADIVPRSDQSLDGRDILIAQQVLADDEDRRVHTACFSTLSMCWQASGKYDGKLFPSSLPAVLSKTLVIQVQRKVQHRKVIPRKKSALLDAQP